MSSSKHASAKKTAASPTKSARTDVVVTKDFVLTETVQRKPRSAQPKAAKQPSVAQALIGTGQLIQRAKARPTQTVSAEEAVELAKRAGILTRSGKLAPFYR